MVDKRYFTKVMVRIFHIKYYILYGIVVSLTYFYNLNCNETKNDYELIQLTSITKNLSEVSQAEMATINRIASEKNRLRNVKTLPKRFKKNPAFQFFAYIEQVMNKADQVKRTAVRTVAEEKN